ncbi:energy transducer TonB [Desulfurispira natronophila]|uniref:Protein TonB n=1 Tax=Desulfurispira natronophila TaxID=682562 RepID=A0A7W7Y3S5_9BACT|nr:TonB family protein [Desulfurispira natronophila]MBB5021532.1 protein TonB [Desulfurispira natronophila]
MTDAESFERLSSRLALLLTLLLGVSLLAAMAAPEPTAREPLRPPVQPLTMAFASPPALPEIPSPPPPPVVKPVTLPEPPAEQAPTKPVDATLEKAREIAPELELERTNKEFEPVRKNTSKPESIVEEVEQVPDEVIQETADAPPADIEFEVLPEMIETNTPVNQVAHESQRQADLLDELLRAVESEKFYPLPARRMGLEGELMITVTLDEQGRLVEFLIEEQGSHRLLRRAAEQTLERVARNFVADLSGSSSESLRFPLRYVLD